MNFSPFYLRNEIRYRQNSLEFIATSLFHKHIVQINKIPPHSFEVSSSIVSFRFFTLKFSKLIETRCIDSWYKVLYFSGKEKTHINDIYIYIEKQTRYFHFHNRKLFLFFFSCIKVCSRFSSTVAKRSFYAEYRGKEAW